MWLNPGGDEFHLLTEDDLINAYSNSGPPSFQEVLVGQEDVEGKAVAKSLEGSSYLDSFLSCIRPMDKTVTALTMVVDDLWQEQDRKGSPTSLNNFQYTINHDNLLN